MKEKIFSALKVAILIDGKTSISDKTLNTYVDLISAQITDESQISEAIKTHVSFLKETQANINSVAAESVTAKEQALRTEYEKQIEDLKKSNHNNPPEEENKDDAPEWAKNLIGKVDTLETSLGAFNAEKTQQTLSQKLLTILKDEKKVPDYYFNPAIAGRTFKDEAEVLAFANDLGAQWEGAKQVLANQGFQETVPPGSGDNETKEVDSFVATITQGTKAIVEQTKN